MVRINRVYTKTGDAGETSLVGGDRISKSSLRIECYGTVDELNAVIGVARCVLLDGQPASELCAILARIQNELFNLGAELATPDPARRDSGPKVEGRHVEALEREIDRLNESLPDLTSFILPGGGVESAQLHHARTVCRRAERLAVQLSQQEEIGDHVVVYLNRLSDALFVFGRIVAQETDWDELLWDPEEA